MDDRWRLPETARLGRVALTASDLDAMIDFYRNIVGLRVQRKGDSSAVLGAGCTPLLVLLGDADAPPRRREQAGLFHTAFKVPNRADLGAALERIESDWKLTGAADHYVSEALYLDDPEGNGVEIYRDLPEESWPRNDDGTIGIGTAPLDLEPIMAASDDAESAPDGTIIGHVHLEVSSLEATREFYVDTVGLGVKTELDSALFLAAGEYHHHLGANTWNRRSEPAGGRGLAWFEIVVPEQPTVTDLRRRLEAGGFSTEALDVGFSVTDANGIEIRFRREGAQ